jgi:hypothetical protein
VTVIGGVVLEFARVSLVIASGVLLLFARLVEGAVGDRGRVEQRVHAEAADRRRIAQLDLVYIPE